MAKDLYVQSNFNENIYIRRDDINGQQNFIYNCQVRNVETLPTEVGRFALGCELLVIETGKEYNNTSPTTTPDWDEVGDDPTIYTADGTLTGNRGVDIDGNQLRIGGLLNTTGSVIWGITDPFVQGFNVLVNGAVSELIGGINYSSVSAVGDLSGIGVADFGRVDIIQNDTNDGRVFEILVNDDGFGNNSPGFNRLVFNADETIFNFFNQNSEETSFGRGGEDGADDVSSNFTMDDRKARVSFDRDLANGTTQQGEIEARDDHAWIRSRFIDASDDRYEAIVEARHNDGSRMKASLLLQTNISSSKTTINKLTLSETGLEVDVLESMTPPDLPSTKLLGYVNNKIVDTGIRLFGINRTNRTRISNYTATSSDGDFFLDATNNSVELTLETAAGANTQSRKRSIINVNNTNAVTVVPNGSEKIYYLGVAETSITLLLGESITISSDGSDWYVV